MMIGGAGVAGAITLAAVVVMLIKRPRTAGEWGVALISTVVSSICGGAAVVLRLNLHYGLRSGDEVEVYLALMEIIGAAFACGLPGWVLVRVAFNTMNKVQDKSADDVYRDAKGLLP